MCQVALNFFRARSFFGMGGRSQPRTVHRSSANLTICPLWTRRFLCAVVILALVGALRKSLARNSMGHRASAEQMRLHRDLLGGKFVVQQSCSSSFRANPLKALAKDKNSHVLRQLTRQSACPCCSRADRRGAMPVISVEAVWDLTPCLR